MARLIERALAGVRLARFALRGAAMRAYWRAAYPGITFAGPVRIGRGVRLRAFAGGQMRVGAGVQFDDGALVLVQGGRLDIGADCLIGRGAVVVCAQAMTIGAGTLMAEYVTLRDQDHRHDGDERLDAQGMVCAPVVIGHDVWLGAKVTVTRGVTIAPHAVVGAHAVVTRDLSVRGVYAGVPARPIAAKARDGADIQQGASC
ncbi:hypothetical protein GTZ99_00050 [Novosphingobium sp. FSY-8]|uniref:Acetyltransferase-like isoleucine patch superfamily enzyme n=1 Tax=Novosphingobium ovatum TaxID=1908523 RepID=A0ABW9X8U2_9SPHN|nr:acyltransferase [Novosphingobium ovatum]NBC34944.1 hypothetical protein [Novosphingobium ovatum]